MAGGQTLLPPRDELLAYGLETLPDPAGWGEVTAGDEALLEELWRLNATAPSFGHSEMDLKFGSVDLRDSVRTSYNAATLTALTDTLAEQGTLRLPIIRDEQHHVVIDGEPRKLTLLAATETGTDGATHGDMSSMIYLRDQIQAAAALMEVSLLGQGTAESRNDGRDLLISALDLMSTETQLKRAGTVTTLGPRAGQADWPSISLHFNDLEGKSPNGWRNKQDSFQMLAYHTLDALERGFLSTEDVTPAHQRYLGGIVPLLAAVDFPHYESSGSWEEVEARRTSVMAVETALLAKIQKLSPDSEVYQFLERGYERAKGLLPVDVEADTSFTRQVDRMTEKGLHELGQRLPDESPDQDYPKNSVKYREADAALTYVLRYGIPELLAERHVPMRMNNDLPMRVEDIEDRVVEKIFGLINPETKGITRYERDSYLGLNFITTGVQWIVGAIKHKVGRDAELSGTGVNLDEKQLLRNELTPQGGPAAWAHPLGQMGSWFAKRSRELREQGNIPRADHFTQLSTHMLNNMLSMVTGEGQWQAVIGKDSECHIKQAPAHKVPEGVVAYQTADGNRFTAPSPHTPLNWGTATLIEMLGAMRANAPRPQHQADTAKVLAMLTLG